MPLLVTSFTMESEGNWKKAGEVLGQTLKAVLSAGGKVLEYIGGVGKRFLVTSQWWMFPTLSWDL